MCVCLCSVTVTGLTAGVSLHLAAVLHRTVVGHLDRLADVGFPALQHLLLVQLLVHPERHQLGARQPLPACTQTHRRWEILKQHNVVSAEQQGPQLAHVVITGRWRNSNLLKCWQVKYHTALLATLFEVMPVVVSGQVSNCLFFLTPNFDK